MARQRALWMVIVVGWLGCGETASDREEGPTVTDISASQMVVGETILFMGRDLLHGDEGTTRVRFQGVFESDIGEVEPVNVVLNPIYDGFYGESDAPEEQVHVLRLNRFGPFGNPLSAQNRPGIFDGRVIAENVHADGTIEADPDPPEATLKVLPSLLIEALEPVHAECGAPAIRGLQGLPYQLTVRPVGIKAVRFEYQFSNVNGATGVSSFTHRFDGPVADDTVGSTEPIVFNPVDPDRQFYVTVVRAMAYDASGRSVETVLPLSVHRPIEVVHHGKQELAERYAPVPVSGCIPGALRSQVSYSESKTDTRQQSVGVTFSSTSLSSHGITDTDKFNEGISQGNSTSQSVGAGESNSERTGESYGVNYGQSTANNVGVSTTDGESWGWNTAQGMSNTEFEDRMNEIYGSGSVAGTVGVSGEGSVPGFAKVTGSVSTTAGVTAGGRTGGRAGETRSESNNRGWSGGGSTSDTQTFGSTTTDNASRSLSGSYAVTQNRARNIADTATRENGRTWNLGTDVAASETVSEGMTESEARTWSDSQSHTSSVGFQGFLPKGQFGVFYRQTMRWVKRAEIRGYDLCGVASHLGEMQFNEWTWAPDLAIGPRCDVQPPASNLPPAQCLIEPCGE